MLKINYCWFKVNYDVKNGTIVQYTPENVHEILLEESCNIKYGPATVADVRLKYTELANQFNKADLIKLAKGRLIKDINLSFQYKFGDNDTRASHVTNAVIDLVDSSDDSDIYASDSNHHNMCKLVYKEILSISSDSEMSDFDRHQYSCHDLELLGSTTYITVDTIKNDIISDCKKNN